MDGIIQLQAQYGHDTDGDGAVDVWNTTSPAAGNTTDWSRVIALRVAVLARSGQFEKTAVTTTAPTWVDGGGVATAFTMTNVDGTADSGAGSLGPNNWRNYRYKAFETTIPIRNLIWFPL
jgi:type IV pilus assembly protein PilW